MEYLREYAIETLDFMANAPIARSGMGIKEALRESLPATATIMRPLYEGIDPLEVGGHRRSLAIGEEYAKRLLRQAKNPNYKEIAERLVWGYPSHDFVVDRDEAKEIGLPVEELDAQLDKQLTENIRELGKNGLPYNGIIGKEHSIADQKIQQSRGRAIQNPISINSPLTLMSG